jgi:hypothetical protein
LKPTLESMTVAHPALKDLFAPGWDFATDILVVVGRSDPEFFEAILQLDQARVINLIEESVEEPPSPFKRAVTALDMYQVILEFAGDKPKSATIRCQPGSSLTKAATNELVESLRGAIATFGIFKETVAMHAPQWALHGIKNMAEVASAPSVHSLEGAFAGIPCVIVSPGPSLDQNLHLLKQFSGRALIMTCSHALHSMEAAGVAPNLITVSDPKFTGRHFKDCTSIESATLCLDAVVEPRNFEFESKRKFTFASHESIAPWIYDVWDETACMESGGSVACVEFSLARWMGCGPVVFVGQDLAMTDGRYYAKSNIDGMAYIEQVDGSSQFELVRPHINHDDDQLTVTRHEAEALRTVKSWDGGTVFTSDSLYTFLRWFGAAARSMETNVFNCTEGGAFIEGMQHISLQEFIDTHALDPVDIDGILEARSASVDFAKRRELMHASLTEMLDGIGKCARIAKKCKQLASRAHRDQRALDELGRSEKQLSKAIAPIKPLSMISQRLIQEAQTRAAKATTLEENLGMAKALFNAVIDSAKVLEEPLVESLRKLAH